MQKFLQLFCFPNGTKSIARSAKSYQNCTRVTDTFTKLLTRLLFSHIGPSYPEYRADPSEKKHFYFEGGASTTVEGSSHVL